MVEWCIPWSSTFDRRDARAAFEPLPSDPLERPCTAEWSPSVVHSKNWYDLTRHVGQTRQWYKIWDGSRTKYQWRRRGGNGGSRLPHLCSDPSWFQRKPIEKFFIYGGPMCMYIVTVTAHQPRKIVRNPPPPTFGAGDATAKCYRTKCHGQNVANKMPWGKMSLVKMKWTECRGQNVLVKMFSSEIMWHDIEQRKGLIVSIVYSFYLYAIWESSFPEFQLDYSSRVHVLLYVVKFFVDLNKFSLYSIWIYRRHELSPPRSSWHRRLPRAGPRRHGDGRRGWRCAGRSFLSEEQSRNYKLFEHGASRVVHDVCMQGARCMTCGCVLFNARCSMMHGAWYTAHDARCRIHGTSWCANKHLTYKNGEWQYFSRNMICRVWPRVWPPCVTPVCDPRVWPPCVIPKYYFGIAHSHTRVPWILVYHIL